MSEDPLNTPEAQAKMKEILDMPDPSKPPIPADKLVVPKNGQSADISGHETLHRKSANELHIWMDGYKWVIKSESPITVYEKEDEEEDYEEEEDDDSDD